MTDGFSALFPFGVWRSTDPIGRWSLDFNDNGCVWTERNSAGTSLRRVVPLLHLGESWKIERPNDADVLRFLGASESLIGQILSLNPRPSFMELNVNVGAFPVKWNGLKWTKDASGHLKELFQPGTSPDTIKAFELLRQSDDHVYFQVPAGQLTFDQEGTEGGLFHSRWLQAPPGVSGVTVGRGYDFGSRTQSTVAGSLTAAGVDAALAAKFAQGAGVTGADAAAFVAKNRSKLGSITPGQQKRLFGESYQAAKADVIRISSDPVNVQKYGAVNFQTLSSKILDVLVDLRFRGDYTPRTREFVQKPAADDDIVAFRSALSDESNWPGVPHQRFLARVAYLQTAMDHLQVISQLAGGDLSADTVQCVTADGRGWATLAEYVIQLPDGTLMSPDGPMSPAQAYYRTAAETFIIPDGYVPLTFSKTVFKNPPGPSGGAEPEAVWAPIDDQPGRISLLAIVYGVNQYASIGVSSVIAIRANRMRDLSATLSDGSLHELSHLP